ncbi:unnamed protein product [Durusdinium trenchii]|uniref:Secreted protein n=1 Tax=Durusdinium trenchii TaxID=1381693 RepID=A0ABP0ITD5_9DINO
MWMLVLVFFWPHERGERVLLRAFCENRLPHFAMGDKNNTVHLCLSAFAAWAKTRCSTTIPSMRLSAVWQFHVDRSLFFGAAVGSPHVPHGSGSTSIACMCRNPWEQRGVAGQIN